MSIQTSSRDSFQIIRMETDMVMESDINTIKETVNMALKAGTVNFVLSVSIGSLTNNRVISRLIEWCRETIWRQKGTLLFIEKNNGQECIFSSLCESLHIPMYQNIDTALLKTSTEVKPKQASAH
jgi:hypothetical protein